MSVVESELFRYADFEFPEPEILADRDRYRDAIVARLTGYRPLMLDIDVPHSEEPVPVVVWLHGGAWMWGTNKHTQGPFSTAAIRDKVVAAGFAFASAQYRLSGEAGWPAQLHDVKAAVRWLKHFAGDQRVDPERIAVWGESAGAHLACLAATTGGHRELEGSQGAVDADSRIRAAVSWYGPTDLTAPELAWAAEALLGGDIGLAAEASPLHHVGADSAPLLLVHGTADSAVPAEHSRKLAAAYAEHGLPAELVLVPGAGHSLAGADPDLYIDRSIAFLRHALGE